MTPTPTTTTTTLAHLHEFTKDIDRRSPNSDSSKRYLVTIKRKTATLRASVRINVRYPAVPPLWTLHPSSHHDNDDRGRSGAVRRTICTGLPLVGGGGWW